jgi:hypothetical protein
MKAMGKKFIGFLILAGILFGLFVVVVAPIEMYKKADAESWPSRKGVISLSYARFTKGYGRTGTPFWDTQICGNYKDSGERFCISRVRYGGFRWGDGKESAFETVAKYPVGREVDVYYSPDNPKSTMLEAHSSWHEMFTLFGLGIVGLLVPVVLWLFRKKIEPERYERGQG